MSDHDFSEPIPPSELHGLDPGELLARGLEAGSPSAGAAAWEPPAPEELEPLLPEYRIANLIGRGSLGAVYKGTQIALDRPVAIKLLPPEIGADAEFVARIFDETRALAKLQHARIIVVQDFGQTSAGHVYIVMEHVDGTNLRQIIQGPGLSPNEALHVVGQICDALRAAHSQGVIHGGIKPENILITGEGYVKVVDFGFARPLNREAMNAPLAAGGAATTADYLAPEQREGRAGERSDIFALGVVFYEMLAGAPPRGAFELPPSQFRGTPVDARIDGIVSMALQADPDRRYQRVSEMKYDVDRIRKTPLPDSAPPAVPTPPVPRKKRRMTLASLAAVLVLLIAIVAFVIWAKGGRMASSRGDSGNARQAIRPANSASGPKVIGHDLPIAQATPKRSSSPARATASAQTAPPSVTPGFALNAAPGRQQISIFNGRDLTGWTGDPRVWSVEDGAITGRAKPGVPSPGYSNLVWKGGLVSDFEITWKYKILSGSSGQPGSGGMFFRAMAINDSLFVRGYFADASSDRDTTGGLRDGFRSRELARQNQQVIIQDGADPGQPVIVEVGQAGNPRELREGIKENGWNDCKVVVSGNGIQLFVNGHMAVDAVDMGALAPRWGTFALARRPPAAVQFKEIRLRDMGSTPRSLHAPGVTGKENPPPREPSAMERVALEDCLTFYKWRCVYTSVPNGDPIQITFDRNGTATSQHFRCPWKITASRTVVITPNNMPVSLEFDESLTHFKGYLAGKDLRYRGEQVDPSNMSIVSGSEPPASSTAKIINLDARQGGISLSGETIVSHPAPPEPARFAPPPRPPVAQPNDLETALLSYKWAWTGIPHRHTFHTVLEFQKDGTIRLADKSDLWRWHKIDSRRFFLDHGPAKTAKAKSLSFVLALNEEFTAFAKEEAPTSGPSGIRLGAIASDADGSPAPAEQARVSVSGVGPSGTNAGWGNARLPMHAIVSTNASTSVNLRVECYWVVVNGSHHSIVPVAASFDRNIRCAPGEQTRIDFEDDTSFHRNNATKDGIDNSAGLFRGWVITVHDSTGKKAGWAANIPEFERLAP